MALFQFLASPTGRLIRAVAGIVLIALGLFVVAAPGGYVLAIVGLVPLLAGLFDFCVIAAVFGKPFSGRELRASK